MVEYLATEYLTTTVLLVLQLQMSIQHTRWQCVDLNGTASCSSKKYSNITKSATLWYYSGFLV